MSIKVTSYEGFRNQIGACILIETEHGKFMLDCGIHENIPILTEPISLPFPAKEIDAVFLTHGHLGHCGLLPELVKKGYSGKIYCAEPTKDLAYLALLEASLVQSEGFQRLKKRNQITASSHSEDMPFYSEEDVQKTQNYLHEVDNYEPICVGGEVSVTFFSSGHIPGSSFMKIQIGDSQQKESFLYIADIGAEKNDLYHPQVVNESYDAVILPKLLKKDTAIEDMRQKLCQIINETHQKAGNIIISVFSLDRRIEILQMIDTLIIERLIPHTLAFLDSPAAEEISAHLRQSLPSDTSTSGVFFFDSVVDSKCLTNISGTTVVICGSGKYMPGRLQFHLKRNLPRANSSLVILGKPTDDGLCGRLLKNPKTISIEDKQVEVKASVFNLYDPNFHADQTSIAQWLNQINITFGTVILTHGSNDNDFIACDNLEFITPEPGETLTIS